MPKVRDTLEAFDSVWLRTLVRRGDKLTALIPQLYVKGMSTPDIEAALSETLEVEGVSKSTVSSLCNQFKHDFERWQNRDSSDQDLPYMFCDGIYLRLRPEDAKAVAVLCAYGIKTDGRKVLLHLAVGIKSDVRRSGRRIGRAAWGQDHARPQSGAGLSQNRLPGEAGSPTGGVGLLGGLRLRPGGRAETGRPFSLLRFAGRDRRSRRVPHESLTCFGLSR